MKNIIYKILLYSMAALYLAAGINHFANPDFYLRLMPPYIPAHQQMILLSGFFEILFAVLLLFRKTRAAAAWGVILMLLAFFSVHIYMLQTRHTIFTDVPEWILWARIPMQFVLIAWAYLFTKKR